MTTKRENNNQDEKDEKKKLNITSLLLNTFTVALKRRKGKLQTLLILAIISFTLFEAVFPVDDTLLFVHFKVSILVLVYSCLREHLIVQDRFNWTEEDFTNFQAFWTLCMVVGQVCTSHGNILFLLIMVFVIVRFDSYSPESVTLKVRKKTDLQRFSFREMYCEYF